jgi:hypothetical protein
MLHSRCFPEHCRTSPGSPPRPRATALTKVFFVSWCTRPGRSQSATSHLSEIQGDRTWTSLRGPSSSHRRVRRRQSRRNRNPNMRLSMRRRNRGGVSRSQAPRSVPLVSGIVGRGVSLYPLLHEKQSGPDALHLRHGCRHRLRRSLMKLAACQESCQRHYKTPSLPSTGETV